MIPSPLLSVVMWTVIAAWALTAMAIFAEYAWRQRKGARAADLMERLTATGALMADPFPELTRADFQDLVSAGLPKSIEMVLARDLRAHLGDDVLAGVAAGTIKASLEDRIQALQILTSGRHPEAHPTLAAALRAPEAEVAAVALRLLRGLDDDQAAKILIDALADGAHSASRIAAALDRMTAERASLLAPLLQHQHANVRFWGLLLAGRTGASQWIWVIRKLVTDNAPMVRRAAVEALGRLGSPDDRLLLVARFFDPSPMVRVHAARAAAVAADESVAEALVKLLTDREWIVRSAARDSLRALGDMATPAVTRTLWHGDAFAANNAAEVLFLTGATNAFVHAFLGNPDNAQRRQLVERLLAVSGAHIVRAVHDQLDGSEQAALQRLLGDAPATPARVRRRS